MEFNLIHSLVIKDKTKTLLQLEQVSPEVFDTKGSLARESTLDKSEVIKEVERVMNTGEITSISLTIPTQVSKYGLDFFLALGILLAESKMRWRRNKDITTTLEIYDLDKSASEDPEIRKTLRKIYKKAEREFRKVESETDDSARMTGHTQREKLTAKAFERKLIEGNAQCFDFEREAPEAIIQYLEKNRKNLIYTNFDGKAVCSDRDEILQYVKDEVYEPCDSEEWYSEQSYVRLPFLVKGKRDYVWVGKSALTRVLKSGDQVWVFTPDIARVVRKTSGPGSCVMQTIMQIYHFNLSAKTLVLPPQPAPSTSWSMEEYSRLNPERELKGRAITPTETENSCIIRDLPGVCVNFPVYMEFEILESGRKMSFFGFGTVHGAQPSPEMQSTATLWLGDIMAQNKGCQPFLDVFIEYFADFVDDPEFIDAGVKFTDPILSHINTAFAGCFLGTQSECRRILQDQARFHMTDLRFLRRQGISDIITFDVPKHTCGTYKGKIKTHSSVLAKWTQGPFITSQNTPTWNILEGKKTQKQLDAIPEESVRKAFMSQIEASQAYVNEARVKLLSLTEHLEKDLTRIDQACSTTSPQADKEADAFLHRYITKISKLYLELGLITMDYYLLFRMFRAYEKTKGSQPHTSLNSVVFAGANHVKRYLISLLALEEQGVIRILDVKFFPTQAEGDACFEPMGPVRFQLAPTVPPVPRRRSTKPGARQIAPVPTVPRERSTKPREKQSTPGVCDPTRGEPNFKTVKQLRAMARDQDLRGVSKLRRAELCKLLDSLLEER